MAKPSPLRSLYSNRKRAEVFSRTRELGYRFAAIFTVELRCTLRLPSRVNLDLRLPRQVKGNNTLSRRRKLGSIDVEFGPDYINCRLTAERCIGGVGCLRGIGF